jgi:hypothetical protein
VAAAWAAWASKADPAFDGQKKAAFGRPSFLADCSEAFQFNHHPKSTTLNPTPATRGIFDMRALLFCLAGLIAAMPEFGFPQQIKLSPKAAPGANETRYFTAIDGLMEGRADVILKETRQGKAVTAAVLDVCYPVEKGSDR